MFNPGTGIEHINDNGDQQLVNASLNYHIVPNKLVGSVNYAHTFYNNNRLVYPADAALDTVQHRTAGHRRRDAALPVLIAMLPPARARRRKPLIEVGGLRRLWRERRHRHSIGHEGFDIAGRRLPIDASLFGIA